MIKKFNQYFENYTVNNGKYYDLFMTIFIPLGDLRSFLKDIENSENYLSNELEIINLNGFVNIYNTMRGLDESEETIIEGIKDTKTACELLHYEKGESGKIDYLELIDEIDSKFALIFFVNTSDPSEDGETENSLIQLNNDFKITDKKEVITIVSELSKKKNLSNKEYEKILNEHINFAKKLCQLFFIHIKRTPNILKKINKD